MSSSDIQQHLSRIETVWTMVLQAHQGQTAQINVAQERIIERYSGAVYRYLLAVLRDQDAADEVLQEFALRVIRGGFRHADEGRGRFRDYVKTAVLRLVTDYYRRRNRRRPVFGASVEDLEGIAVEDGHPGASFEQSFLDSCREELLGRAWGGLQVMEENTGQPYYSVLQFRAHYPKTTSDAMAEELTLQLNPPAPFTPAGVRKMLQRARVKFSELLLYEVTQMMGRHTPEELEEELIELGLQPYCQAALSRRQDAADAEET